MLLRAEQSALLAKKHTKQTDKHLIKGKSQLLMKYSQSPPPLTLKYCLTSKAKNVKAFAITWTSWGKCKMLQMGQIARIK